MAIWFALSIPFVTCLILYFLFHHKTAWWELLIPFAVSFILIISMKFAVETSQTRDVEYWTGWVTEAQYHEKWTEEWDTYHPPTYDSDGNMTSAGYWEHHVQHHPPYWKMIENNGMGFRINEKYYKHLVSQFQNEREVNLSHMNQTSIGDGDMYVTKWNNKRDTMVVCTSTHSYENRIQVSDSIFNFPDVEDTTGLFNYPEISDRTQVPSILGDGGPTLKSANRNLCISNAELGRKKQVRMWVLVFKNAPLQMAMDQECYWEGGNKNEMVLCVGVDDAYKVEWAYVFSWSESEKVKIDIRQFAQSQDTLDLNAIADNMADRVSEGFVRKPFAEFSYLTVVPPMWAVITVYVVTILLNAGIAVFATLNRFDSDNPTGEYRYKWR